MNVVFEIEPDELRIVLENVRDFDKTYVEQMVQLLKEGKCKMFVRTRTVEKLLDPEEFLNPDE